MWRDVDPRAQERERPEPGLGRVGGDTEMESGCGITPIKYKNKSLVHALQWAIGLEWYLQVNDPWQVVMSTDHPNGG